MTEQPTYATIAEAEAVIIAAGYVRDTQRHVWVNNGKTAKVAQVAVLGPLKPPGFYGSVVTPEQATSILRFSINWG